MSLLGEMTALPGTTLPMFKDATVNEETGLRHSVSYAAQTPWLQHESIKNNILFGSEYDASRYSSVVEACALLPDFELLEFGDETEIGTGGVVRIALHMKGLEI